MNKSIKGQQGGFTLIELIVVIVILGILAATALPRFAALGGEARLSSLNAARGALSATSAMTHGRFLMARAATIPVEGVNVNMNLASGYPAITTTGEARALADAAGLTAADYTITAGSGLITISPAKLDAAAQATCKLTYNEAKTAGTRNVAPVVQLVTTDCE